jgi:hypothetical protein
LVAGVGTPKEGEGGEGIERREAEWWKGRVAWRTEGLGLICMAKLNWSSGMPDRNLRCTPGVGNQVVEKDCQTWTVLGKYGDD